MAEELTRLVNRCLTGDQPSFQTLLDRFRGQVFGRCYLIITITLGVGLLIGGWIGMTSKFDREKASGELLP